MLAVPSAPASPSSVSTKGTVFRALSNVDSIKTVKMSAWTEFFVEVFNKISFSGKAGTNLWENFQNNVNFERKWKEISPLLLEVAKATIVDERISVSTPELGEMTLKNAENEILGKGIFINFNDGTTQFIPDLDLVQVKQNIAEHILKNSSLYSKVSSENQRSVNVIARDYAIESLLKIMVDDTDRIRADILPNGGTASSELTIGILAATPKENKYRCIYEMPVKTENFDVIIRESFMSFELIDRVSGQLIADIPMPKTENGTKSASSFAKFQLLKAKIRSDVLSNAPLHSPDTLLSVVFSQVDDVAMREKKHLAKLCDSLGRIGTPDFNEDDLAFFEDVYNFKANCDDSEKLAAFKEEHKLVGFTDYHLRTFGQVYEHTQPSNRAQDGMQTEEGLIVVHQTKRRESINQVFSGLGDLENHWTELNSIYEQKKNAITVDTFKGMQKLEGKDKQVLLSFERARLDPANQKENGELDVMKFHKAVRRTFHETYRPNDKYNPLVDGSWSEKKIYVEPEVSEEDKNFLKLLSYYNYQPLTVFCSFGYSKAENNEQGVSFSVLHPLVLYAIKSNAVRYPDTEDFEELTAVTTEKKNPLTLSYQMDIARIYTENKDKMDPIFKNMYDANDGTLNFSDARERRNMLI